MNIAGFSIPFYKVTFLLLSMLLAACGGGGGGGGGGEDGPLGEAATVELDCGTINSDEDRLPDCYEEYIGTDRFAVDTDGDGLNDDVEVIDFVFNPGNDPLKFNPLVADVPRLSFEFTSIPKIQVNYEFSDGTTDSEAVGATTGFTSAQSNSTTNTRTTSVETTLSAEVGLFNASVSASVTMKNEHSFSYTKEQSTENSQGYSRLNETTSTEGTNYTGGTIEITLQITNTGHQNVHLKDLSLSAVLADPQNPGSFIPVGNLVYVGSFPADGLPISPNSSTVGTLTFTGDIQLAEALTLLRDSSDLIIQPAAWDILAGTGENARSFAVAETAIGARDATVRVDYGPRSGRTIESYRVAATSTQETSIGIVQAMEGILSIDTVVFGTVPWDFDGTLGNTFNGITSIRGVEASSDDNGRWVVLYSRPNPADPEAPINKLYDSLEEAYDLTDIALQSGHVIEFIYLQDKDRDGAFARIEALYGTSDDIVDTDGDGLSDNVEINGPSHPLFVDFDEDGLTDPEELDAGTDPLVADSDLDGDGLNHLQEQMAGTNTNNPDSDTDTISDFCDATPLANTAPDSAGDTDRISLCLAVDELTTVDAGGGLQSVITNDGSGRNISVVALGDPVLTNDRNGWKDTAIGFDGVDDTLGFALGNSASNIAAQSYAVWFKPTLAARDDGLPQIVIASTDGFISNILSWNDSALTLHLDNGGECTGALDIINISGVALNQWSQVTVTLGYNPDPVINAEIIKVYVNGVLNSTTEPVNSCFWYQNFTWRIGNTFDAWTDYGAFQGSIDDTRVYWRELSVDEVTELYQVGHIVTPVPQ